MKIEMPKAPSELIAKLYKSGYKAYIVGGCVRDTVLGREPNDYDICTAARPDETMEVFKDYHVIPTGIKHGTVTVMVDHKPYEVTTFRIDGSYSDNRRPDHVEFTTDIEKDLSRRDFTMNAIAFNPYDGISDPFGGIGDIKKGIIRSVRNPDERFNEDALRILRAWRFACQLGFEIEEETKKSTYRNIGLIKNVSSERIRDELFRMLDYPRRLSDYILRRNPDIIKAAAGCEEKDMHDPSALAAASDYDKIVRLAALLGYNFGMNADEADSTMRSLKFDNDTRCRVTELVRNIDMKLIPDSYSIKRGLNKTGEAQYRRLLQLGKITGKCESPSKTKRMLDKITDENQCYRTADLKINGNDLIKSGIKPGKDIGIMLNRLLDMVMRGELKNDRDELLNEVKYDTNK
ncbi:MAG: CCA tRNA nucleotidyltransferase [Candidatus Ornithomonoglobus sp.]